MYRGSGMGLLNFYQTTINPYPVPGLIAFSTAVSLLVNWNGLYLVISKKSTQDTEILGFPYDCPTLRSPAD